MDDMCFTFCQYKVIKKRWSVQEFYSAVIFIDIEVEHHSLK